jgi:hypothetical protein
MAKKLIFLRDYSPRKKDEIAEFKTHDELRTAEWYLANGIARECDCVGKAKTDGCSDCEENAKKATAEVEDHESETESAEKPRKNAKAGK